MAKRDDVFAAGRSVAGRVEIGRPGVDFCSMTRQCLALALRSTQKSVHRWLLCKRVHRPSERTGRYCERRERSQVAPSSGCALASSSRDSGHTEWKYTQLMLLAIIVIELVLASASTTNGQAVARHTANHKRFAGQDLIRPDRAKSIGATVTTAIANDRSQQRRNGGPQQQHAGPQAAARVGDRGRGADDKVDIDNDDQVEAETIERARRPNYLDLGARHNGHNKANQNKAGADNKRRVNKLGAVCNDCSLAIPLVALVGGRQINGFIVRPAPAELRAPGPYGPGPIVQVDGPAAIRDGHERQSADSNIGSGDDDDSNNNDHDHDNDNGVGRPRVQSSARRPRLDSDNQHLYHGRRHDHHGRHYKQPPAPVVRPFEPKSDEYCPMDGSMTVCDQIGQYPADAIVHRIQGLERALYKMHFNLDSLFSDERDNLSEPFESMAMAADSNITKTTRRPHLSPARSDDSLRSTPADLNSKYRPESSPGSTYQRDTKSTSAGESVPRSGSANRPGAIKSRVSRSASPGKQEIASSISGRPSGGKRVRGPNSHEPEQLKTLAGQLTLSPRRDSRSRAATDGMGSRELGLRADKTLRVNRAARELVDDISASAEAVQDTTRSRGGQIASGDHSAVASSHGSGPASGSLESSFESEHGARDAAANSRQSHKPALRQRWWQQQQQLDLEASERLAAAAISGGAVARADSDVATKSEPSARHHAPVNDAHGCDGLGGGPIFCELSPKPAASADGDIPVKSNQSQRSPRDNVPVGRAGHQPRGGRRLADVARAKSTDVGSALSSDPAHSPAPSRDDDGSLTRTPAETTAQAASSANSAGAPGGQHQRRQRQNLLSPIMPGSALLSGHKAGQIEPESSTMRPLLDAASSSYSSQRQQSSGMHFVTRSPLGATRDEESPLAGPLKLARNMHTGALRAPDGIRAHSIQSGLERPRRQVSDTTSDSAAQADNDDSDSRRAGADNSNLSDESPSDESSDEGAVPQPICRARSIYISPRAAMNDKKQWKYVVNARERDPRIRQIIRVDICESPFEPCSGDVTLPLGYSSQWRDAPSDGNHFLHRPTHVSPASSPNRRTSRDSKQKYAKKKLLALDSQTGLLEVDSFFIPSCCICQLVPDASRDTSGR